jgi:hypothetical protein
MVGSIVNMLQFVIFLLVPIGGNKNPSFYIVPLLMGGLANSFFGAVNAPMVALIVAEKYYNTAFGVLDAV